MTSRSKWLRGLSVGTLLFLYGPILVILVFSFNVSKMSVVWEGGSLYWYRQLAGDHSLWLATRHSLVIGGVSTLVSLMLGIGSAVILERRRIMGQPLVEGILLLPLVIPEIMLGVALLLFFVLIKWPLGLTTVIIGHCVFNLPLVIMVLRARLRKINPVWDAAARDLGATPWQAFIYVTFPLLRPAIWGAGLMAFTLSLDDFVVTFFTTGPGATTLPLKVFSMMRTGITPEINALSAVLVTVSMLFIGVSLVLQRK
ncbi:ABC transporter permease [Candidatus Nitronereus thalassa]|uniref:ABC transporter permease n=1 Tax=Candidatus Nitronereus thalassa TaxID=3020898 RepID=A0ABU3K5A2_9BACT|nr:ABC transporter permease [Candidatus Nitronereus thalassa]MDT7041607.1 ABC transporter permease [Candidatus Nitronereus thalassa]